jgi:cytochrome c oxidase subunit I+III
MSRRVLDVGGLPPIEFGHKDTLWWAMVFLNAIEGTMLALLAVAYFYVADRTSPFPPTLCPRSLGWLATVDLAILLVSLAPTVLMDRASRAADLGGMRRWLIVVTVLGWSCVGLRVLLFQRLPFRWDQHAYGSVVWSMLGLQTFHLASSVVENTAFLVLLYRGPVAHSHRADLSASTLLWYLVVAGALTQWGVVFLDILRTGAG